MILIILAMRLVPFVEGISGRGHKAAARLDQPPSQQDTLSKTIATIRVLDLVGLFGEIECLFHRGRENHFKRLLGKIIHCRVLDSLRLLTVDGIDHLQKGAAVLQSLHGNGFGQD